MAASERSPIRVHFCTGMSKKIRPAAVSPSVQRIRPAIQEKIAACHSPALELAFRELRVKEEHREEEQRDAIRRAGASPLGRLEPQFGGATEGLTCSIVTGCVAFM